MKLTLQLLLITSINFASLAQSVVQINTICDNDVNTDWASPNNDNLPLWDHDNNSSTPKILDTRFLNGLDWVNGNTSGSGYTTSNMYFTENDPYGNMTNVKPIVNPNPWYHYLYYGDDLLPENGWEILLHNLGRYPDNVTIHNFEDKKFTPYIVLYNRYTSIIRVFVTYGKNPMPNNAINGVKIDLSFAMNSSNPNDPNNVVSGVLRHGHSIDQALDVQTEVIKMSAVAKSPGEENKWYSADFRTGYDPCTCMFPSRLALQFNWFSETEFSLNGRQITLEENLTDATVKELINKDYLGSFEYVGEDAKNGFVIYQSLEKAVDDYIAQMEHYKAELEATNQHNAKVKRNLAIVKAFKSVIISGVSATSAGVGGIAISAALNGNADWANDFVTNASDLIQKDTVSFYTLEKETKKLIGAQFDFFSSKNFKEKPKPTKPNEPLVSYSEMAFKGKLFNDLPISGPDFMAPGTFNNQNTDASINIPYVFKYPIYNDVLGTFALLETPMITISRDIHEEYKKNVEYKYSTYQVQNFQGVYQSWTTNYQLKLATDLKFALNSVLDVKDYSIDVALVIKDSIGKPINYLNDEYFYYNGLQSCFTDPNYITNLSSTNSDENSLEDIYNFYNFENGNEFNAPPGYVHYRPYLNPESIPTYKRQVRNYTSNFMPIDAFYQSVYEFGIKNQRVSVPGSEGEIQPEDYGFNHNISVELKLQVNIEFYSLDQHGENNRLTETFTYSIPNSHLIMVEGDIIPNLASTSYNLDFPENLNFTNVNFDGSVIDGCKLNGSIYECKALNTVSLDGVIQVGSGYDVHFIAGNEIVEHPGCEINPEVTREIIQFLDFSHPIPQQTEAEVVTFCGTINNPSEYKANASTKDWKTDNFYGENDDYESFDYSNYIFEINVYPNPSSGKFNVKVTDRSSNIKISIYDMLGREVKFKKSDLGQNEFFIEFSEPSTGMYNIQVIGDNGQETKRILVK